MLTSDSEPPFRHSAARWQPSRPVALLGVAAGMVFVFLLDTMTALPSVHHLYYFPIIFAAVTFGIRGGVITPAVAIVLYHVANPHTFGWRYRESDIVQISVFIAVGMVAARLADDARRLHRLAMTDDLTGLHNLRSFELSARSLLQQARSAGAPFSLLVFDVDRLKTINDSHGHLAGADAVRTVGRTIAAQMPSDAIACRYGGDEFVIALSGRPLSAVEHLANELRRVVEATAPTLAHLSFPPGTLSISIGLAWRSADGTPHPSSLDEEIEALFQAADGALYVAKREGRNRVHVAGGPHRTQSALRQPLRV